MTARHGVLVLGMHRSGTSMVSGLLVRAGLQAPRTPLPPTEWNPEGYGESAVLSAFHERLLQQAGTRWDAYTGIDPEWLASEAAAETGAECRDLLSREFDLSQAFALKDPRLCRLLPFWRTVLEAEGIRSASVLVLRHPAEVAASLAARDGLSPDFSRLVWLRHVLDAEVHSRGMARALVWYDEVLTNWRLVLERIEHTLGCGAWPEWTPRAAEIERFVRQDLRHHAAHDLPQCTPAIGDWLERAWTALRSLGGPGESDAMSALDAVRLEFDEVTDAFGREAERRLASALARARALEEEGRLRVDTLNLELEAARSAIVALGAECAALRSSMSWRLTAPLRALYGFLRTVR